MATGDVLAQLRTPCPPPTEVSFQAVAEDCGASVRLQARTRSTRDSSTPTTLTSEGTCEARGTPRAQVVRWDSRLLATGSDRSHAAVSRFPTVTRSA